jgi:K+-sensing histidine kinase KdpD
VSIAIRNSQLFESTQQSLAEINTIYRQTLKETWAKTVTEQGNSGYQFGVSGNQPLREELKTEGAKQAIAKGELIILQGNSEPELATPIKLRGQTIGVINVRAPEGHIWKQNEINVLQAIAERVAVSAENARLFEETTRRAERERAVSTITTKIRSTNDPEEMLAIAINEIKNALNAKEIRIKEPETGTEPSTNS